MCGRVLRVGNSMGGVTVGGSKVGGSKRVKCRCVFQGGVSNVHGSMLMYLLERGLINARAVKSCVLVGMDWGGRGWRESGQDEHKGEWMYHTTLTTCHTHTPTPTPSHIPDTVPSVPLELHPQRSQ